MQHTSSPGLKALRSRQKPVNRNFMTKIKDKLKKLFRREPKPSGPLERIAIFGPTWDYFIEMPAQQLHVYQQITLHPIDTPLRLEETLSL
ncbi:hypothetical protein NpNSSI1_00000388 [Neofusicoccum parvum]|uniref:Uncharacterized protein n=2 Tax=Neofusicoccum TaxID=407951 RepID=A0ABR3SX04_9PEZI|nr:hypothetical protein NpPPO83_00011733 [Neofusicoccum parvum]GME66525.1 hypothetical protein NpNSSI1_00000388 [Neofusicoccum parvum]